MNEPEANKDEYWADIGNIRAIDELETNAAGLLTRLVPLPYTRSRPYGHEKYQKRENGDSRSRASAENSQVKDDTRQVSSRNSCGVEQDNIESARSDVEVGQVDVIEQVCKVEVGDEEHRKHRHNVRITSEALEELDDGCVPRRRVDEDDA